MGCGASNVATPTTPNNQTQTRQVTSNAVPRIVHKPLTQPKNYRHGSPITQGDLNNQRTEFWTSRIGGNTHMWQAIRSAAEALIANDLPLANAIIEASNIATPQGTLEVCYDERGYEYKVPIYCYSNPTELTMSGLSNNPNPTGVTNTSTPTNSTRHATNSSEPLAPLPSSGTTIKLRIRVNPGDHNVTVVIDPILSILQLKQQIVVEANKTLPPNTVNITTERQRIIFMGKELDNLVKLKDCKFDDSKVVQVFLRPEAKK